MTVSSPFPLRSRCPTEYVAGDVNVVKFVRALASAGLGEGARVEQDSSASSNTASIHLVRKMIKFLYQDY